ncbi:NUDIX hydrolase [Alkalicoccobacillus porphyridii]|uniref:NUDIX domain-containing protein n=1 Tax=Alkalicoccobacillus porphyridii TaxID=2597270 RepID=A0A553ZVQ5_9BACI|nr:NUDIX domain-containing protein [Alkalicoccobacillus porphyridii]TSB45554.1 NUDIX domain-containing protein [Alkalicoccobacillus porphyridii]
MHIVVVEGAVKKDEKILIIKRSAKEEHAAGELALVGGKVDETGASYDVLEETLRREIQEEVGIEVKEEMVYVHSSTFVSDQGVSVVMVVFLCEHQKGEAYVKSEDEVDSVYWMTINEIVEHPDTRPWLKESVQRVDMIRDRGRI